LEFPNDSDSINGSDYFTIRQCLFCHWKQQRMENSLNKAFAIIAL